jgi:hypothetical protein
MFIIDIYIYPPLSPPLRKKRGRFAWGTLILNKALINSSLRFFKKGGGVFGLFSLLFPIYPPKRGKRRTRVVF